MGEEETPQGKEGLATLRKVKFLGEGLAEVNGGMEALKACDRRPTSSRQLSVRSAANAISPTAHYYSYYSSASLHTGCQEATVQGNLQSCESAIYSTRMMMSPPKSQNWWFHFTFPLLEKGRA